MHWIKKSAIDGTCFKVSHISCTSHACSSDNACVPQVPTYNTAGWNTEAEVFDQKPIAIRLAQVLHFHHLSAQPGRLRDCDAV